MYDLGKYVLLCLSKPAESLGFCLFKVEQTLSNLLILFFFFVVVFSAQDLVWHSELSSFSSYQFLKISCYSQQIKVVERNPFKFIHNQIPLTHLINPPLDSL